MDGDPVFKTRDELIAWTRRTSRKADSWPRPHQLTALEVIERVTLAHSHLLADSERKNGEA